MARIIKFKKWKCTLEIGRYSNNRRALSLVAAADTEDVMKGEQIATASVNIPGSHLEPDEVIIKDWSENEGMIEALVEAFVVAEPHRFIPTGMVTGKVCKLLI